MAQNWKHKKYFKLYNHLTSTYTTFSSVEDAKTKIGFGACWDAGSPTKTYALGDSDSTLVVTFTFNSEADQSTHKTAVDSAFTDVYTMFTGNTLERNPAIDTTPDWESLPSTIQVWEVRCVKAEWFNGNDEIENTATFDYTIV